MRVPDVGLAVVDDIPLDRFRVRFGPVRGSEQVVPPERSIAIESVEDYEIGYPTIAEYLDPVSGDLWPVVESPVSANGTWHARRYDPAALVVRGIYAELQPRLAWWAPAWPESDWGWSVSGSLAERLYERLPSVLRWLVAGGATMQPSAPIMEGVLTSMAEGDSSIPGMVRRAREKLRGAVLGPLPLEAAVTVVELDRSAVGEAIAAAQPDPLLGAHPELLTTTRPLVAVAPADDRADIETLLLGLRDAVRVVSREEIADAVLQMPEHATSAS